MARVHLGIVGIEEGDHARGRRGEEHLFRAFFPTQAAEIGRLASGPVRAVVTQRRLDPGQGEDGLHLLEACRELGVRFLELPDRLGGQLHAGALRRREPGEAARKEVRVAGDALTAIAHGREAVRVAVRVQLVADRLALGVQVVGFVLGADLARGAGGQELENALRPVPASGHRGAVRHANAPTSRPPAG